MTTSADLEPRFLYPTSRQFPFDAVCEQIVRALEERKWDVPGITVEFDSYGSGNKYRMVHRIIGDDFKLWFCRPQGRLGQHYNDTAAVSEIIIPKRELHVYEDESGPTFYTYVGTDWEKDKPDFMRGWKVNSKLDRKPRTYLKYSGACGCQYTAGASFDAVGFLTASITGDTEKLRAMKHSHRGRRSPLLVHDNDLGRKYEPEGDEPMAYNTHEVFAEFTQWLQAELLERILAQPV